MDEAEALKEIDGFEKSLCPADLTRDLAVLRHVVASGIRSGNHNLVVQAEQAIGRLSKEWLRGQFIAGKYLSKEQVLQLFQRIYKLQRDYLETVLTSEQLADFGLAIGEQIVEIVGESQPSQSELNKIRRIEFDER